MALSAVILAGLASIHTLQCSHLSKAARPGGGQHKQIPPRLGSQLNHINVALWSVTRLHIPRQIYHDDDWNLTNLTNDSHLWSVPLSSGSQPNGMHPFLGQGRHDFWPLTFDLHIPGMPPITLSLLHPRTRLVSPLCTAGSLNITKALTLLTVVLPYSYTEEPASTGCCVSLLRNPQVRSTLSGGDRLGQGRTSAGRESSVSGEMGLT